MRPIKLGLFNSHGLIVDVLERLKENYNDNVQWIQDCISESKNRQENGGPTIPMTPMGRPKTRNYMRKRALQLELANKLNASHKSSNSTPRLNRSVTFNVVTQHLSKSIGLKKKIVAKAIKNSGKKSKKAEPGQIKDARPLRTALFKSPVSKAVKPAVAKIPNPVTTSDGAHETANGLRKRNVAKPPAEKVETEKKPPARKGRANKVPINNHLKNNLKSLAEDILLIENEEPAPKKVAIEDRTKPMTGIFKSPLKSLKQKLGEAKPVTQKAVKKRVVIKKEPPAVKVISGDSKDEFDDDSVLPELCDKSLQVSMPSLSEVPITNEDLNPHVKLVDIGVTISTATNDGQKEATPSMSLRHTDLAKKSSSPNINGKDARKSCNIFSSTPANTKHLHPFVMLEKLDLTRISSGGSPPGRTLDRSDVSYEISVPRTLSKHPVSVVESHKVLASAAQSRAADVVMPSPAKVPSNIVTKDVISGTNARTVTVHAIDKFRDKPDQLVPSAPSVIPSVHGSAQLNASTKPIELVPCMPKNVANTVHYIADNMRSIYTISSANSTAIPPHKVRTTSNAVEEEISSYDMTPVKKVKKFLPSTTDDYNIRDLDSDDSTDDECRPRKQIPAWARSENLKRALLQQALVSMEEVHAYFDSVAHENLDLNKIFINSKRQAKLNKRTSSACWDTAPLKKCRF